MAIEFLALANLTVGVLKPFVNGVASGIGEAAGAKIWDLLARKFTGDPGARHVLDGFSKNPDAYQGALVDVITQKIQNDPGFAAQLDTIVVNYNIQGDYVQGDKVLGDKVGTKIEQKYFMGLLTVGQIKVLVILSLILQWVVYSCTILNPLNLVSLLPCAPVVLVIAGFGLDAASKEADKGLKRLSILSGISPFIYGVILVIAFAVMLALGIGGDILKGVLPTPTP